MRITQSMLSNNMLRNLSTSYNRMGKLQEQVTSGKKVNRPSDDPVVVMKGMGYRMQVDKVDQFKSNLGEVHNWLDSTDNAFAGVGQALHRANELMVNAPTATLTQEDREMLLAEIQQLRLSVQELANTKTGDKFIFSGTKTDMPLYDKINGFPTDPTGYDKNVEIEVFDDILMKVNTKGLNIFKDIDDMFNNIEQGILTNAPNLDSHITATQAQMDVILTERADIGARQNRAELMDNRLDLQEESVKKQQSENEDIDQEKVITDMITQESVHRMALAVGARIIQPSLVDFLR